MSNAQMVSVDIAMLFDSLGVSGEAMAQMNGLASTAVQQSAPVAEKQTTPAKVQQTEAVATAADDFPPADDELPFDVEEAKPAVQITVKDLQNIVYHSFHELDIEVYTDRKDPELEQRVEAVLTAHEIFFHKSEVWIEEEKMYEVLYEVTV